MRRAEPGRRAPQTSFALSRWAKPSVELVPCPRKPVKQHNRCVIWLTQAGAVELPPAGLREGGKQRTRLFSY